MLTSPVTWWMTAIVSYGLLSSCGQETFLDGGNYATPGPPQEVLASDSDALPTSPAQALEDDWFWMEFVHHPAGLEIMDDFAISEASKFDLLITIDDSPTMATFQPRLDRLDALLSSINNTDWQIAVNTTTDTIGGQPQCLRDIVKKSDFDADPVAAKARFRSAVIAGTGGHWIERGIMMAVKGINGECGSTVTPWVRDGSTVASLIVSSEDNCGSFSNEGCPTAPHRNPSFFVENTPKDTRAYALMWIPGQSCPGATTATSGPGYIYQDLVNLTGGQAGSLCDNDYTGFFQSMSEDVARLVKREFKLRTSPLLSSMRLFVDDEEFHDFSVDGDQVKINNISGNNERLKVLYTPAPTTAPRTDFALQGPVNPNTLVVVIDGALQDEANYSFDESSQTLILVEAAPDKAKVEIGYQKIAK